MENHESRIEHTTPWGKVWTHGANILNTFKSVVINPETGEKWKPPTEYRNDWLFKINRDNGNV